MVLVVYFLWQTSTSDSSFWPSHNRHAIILFFTSIILDKAFNSLSNTWLPLGCRGSQNLLKNRIIMQEKTEHSILDVFLPVLSPSAIPFFQKSSICSLPHSNFSDITSALTSPRSTYFPIAYFCSNQWIFFPIFSKFIYFSLLSRNLKSTNIITISSPTGDNTLVWYCRRV